MRLLAGGLLLLLAMPPLLRAQDSVIVIDPDLPPGDSAVVAGRPAARRRGRAAGLLQRQRHDPGAGRRELPGRQRVRRPAGDLPRRRSGSAGGCGATSSSSTPRCTCCRARTWRATCSSWAAGSSGARVPGTWDGSGCCGTRHRCCAPPTGRWCCASAAARSASWPRRAPASRPAASGPTLLLATGGHVQPDRGAADRLRPDLRAPAVPAVARAAGPARHPPHRG